MTRLLHARLAEEEDQNQKVVEFKKAGAAQEEPKPTS